MKKLTDEQIKQIVEARKEVLVKLDIFKLGLLFPEIYAKQEECPRKHWIDVVILRLKTFDVENWEISGKSLLDYTDFEVGIMMERYFREIYEVFLEEFSKVIDPFKIILYEYQRDVYEIFKK